MLLYHYVFHHAQKIKTNGETREISVESFVNQRKYLYKKYKEPTAFFYFSYPETPETAQTRQK